MAGGALGHIERAPRPRLLLHKGASFQGDRTGAQKRDNSSGDGEQLLHFFTSSWGRKPGPATGTSSPAKGCGGRSQPVRLPSGAFSLLSWTYRCPARSAATCLALSVTWPLTLPDTA